MVDPRGRQRPRRRLRALPREEILAVIAAEAARAGTTIVGENLGTVPEEVSEALERWDVLGLHEEQFSLYQYHHGSDGQLGPVPARSVAGIRTHDMPAFAAAFNGDPTGAVHEYRRLLEDTVGHHVGDEAADVLDAVLERLAGATPTSCWPTSTTWSARSHRTTCRVSCSSPPGGDDYVVPHRACSPTATSVAGSSS